MYPFSPKPWSHSRLPHNIEQSFLCNTVGPCPIFCLNFSHSFPLFLLLFLPCFISLLFFGCTGSLKLCRTFSSCGKWGLLLMGVTSCGAQSLGTQASVAAVLGLSGCCLRTLDHMGLSSCGTGA